MRFCLVIAIVWTVLAVFPSDWIRAGDHLAWAPKAAEGEADKAAHGHDGAHDDKGHPADVHGAKDAHNAVDDPFAGWLDLTIWTIVVFTALVLVLWFSAWKHIREGLDKREQAIASAMEEAKLAREEAARLRDQLQAEMVKANEQIRQMLDKARVDAEATAGEMIAKGKSELQAERERLSREMQIARDQALHEIWNQAANLSTLIAAKVVGKSLNGDDHRHLIESALAEFRQAAEERKRDYLSVRA